VCCWVGPVLACVLLHWIKVLPGIASTAHSSIILLLYPAVNRSLHSDFTAADVVSLEAVGVFKHEPALAEYGSDPT
jgi:hypothetical protein